MRDKKEGVSEIMNRTMKDYGNKIEENALEKDKRCSRVVLSLNGNKLSLRIGGEDLIRVRTATNTRLRLVKVAEEMTCVVKECDSHGF